MRGKTKVLPHFIYKENLYIKDIMVIYFDTETSGLNPGQICQLSYVMQTKEKVLAKNFFFSVDSVEYGAYCVHGFSVEKLKILSNGKRFSDCFNEIYLDFNNADMLISHNTAFDFMFMRKEYERLNKVFEIKNSFCTMKKTTPILKLPRSSGAGYKYPKLNELASYYGITDGQILIESKKLFSANAGYHDARFDTTAVYLAVNKSFWTDNAMGCVKEFL